MVSRQISDLSTEDLNYLEHILGREFANITERNQQFKTKNGWCPEDANSRKLLRLINAVRSQKYLARIEKW